MLSQVPVTQQVVVAKPVIGFSGFRPAGHSATPGSNSKAALGGAARLGRV